MGSETLKLEEGHLALITGGARGIGKGIVETFARAGASVAFTYVSDRSRSSAEQLAKELSEQHSIRAVAYQSDAGDFQQAETLVSKVVSELGTISTLVNNAGITRDNLLLRMTEQQWDEVIATNLKSIFNLSKAILKPMMGARRGAIINISSIVGLQGNAGQSNYAASKAGVIGFSKSLAKEVGSRGIRVNTITPGFIETEMTEELSEDMRKKWVDNIPLKRGGQPEDVAMACIFLASPMGAYITGQTLSVDGGLYM